VGHVDRRLAGGVARRVEDLLARARRVVERGGERLVAPVGDEDVDQHLAQRVRRADQVDQHEGDVARVEPAAERQLLLVGLLLLGLTERVVVGRLDAPGVALDHRGEPERDLVVGVVVLVAVELEVLVVEGVGELVRDRRAHVRRQRRTPHHQLGGLGVVKADHPAAQQRPHRLDQVDLGLDQTEALEHDLGLAQVAGVLVEVGEQPILERALAGQLDIDRFEELAPPFLLDERADLGHHGLDLGLGGGLRRLGGLGVGRRFGRAVAGTGRVARVVAGRGRPDEHHRRDQSPDHDHAHDGQEHAPAAG
jgi:hypothetical protein